MCTVKGSDVRPSVIWFPPRLRGRCGTMCTAKASDVRSLASLGLRLIWVPGVEPCVLPRGWIYALASLDLRLFYVAGVGPCALPRGRLHALASLSLRLICVGLHSLLHSLASSPTHKHTHSLTHSLPPSLTPSLPHSPSHSVRFTSIIIIMCQRCLPARGHAERIHKMCGYARKSAKHYFGQRKYGEHTIVLIVCRFDSVSEGWKGEAVSNVC